MFRPVELGLAALALLCSNAFAAPTVTRLTPPSELFASGNGNPPVIARFLPASASTCRPPCGWMPAPRSPDSASRSTASR